MHDLYARIVLFLIRPALRLYAQRGHTSDMGIAVRTCADGRGAHTPVRLHPHAQERILNAAISAARNKAASSAHADAPEAARHVVKAGLDAARAIAAGSVVV